MENKIKELYQRLTNKQLETADSVISPEAFSSVLLDRFNSELIKMGIFWDKNATSINKLVSGTNTQTTTSNSGMSAVLDKENSLQSDTNLQVGIDIQKVDKFPAVKDFWEDSFYTENFKESEIAHCLKKANPFESFAGIFAAKEAIFKAAGVDRAQVVISFSKTGKPISQNVSISISHDGDYATAVAILDKGLSASTTSQLAPSENKTAVSEVQSVPVKKSNTLSVIALGIIVIYIVFKEYDSLLGVFQF